jgi:hypothetical protein
MAGVHGLGKISALAGWRTRPVKRLSGLGNEKSSKNQENPDFPSSYR